MKNYLNTILLLLVICIIIPGFISAQDLKFDNLVLISGVDLQIGAVYRQADAAAGIDAEITIVDLTGGTTLQVFDDNGTAEIDAFQPRVVKSATLFDEYARFQIDFYVAGTSTPVSVINASVSGVDIDGCCVLKEYVTFYDATSYTLENPTVLTAAQSGNATRFIGIAGGPPGIDYTATDYIANVEYASTASFVFDIGAEDMGTFPVRQASIYFKNITFSSPSQRIVSELGLCSNSIDDDGDCLVDCADPDCGVSIQERTMDEPIQYVWGQPDFTSNSFATTDSTLYFPRDVVQDTATGKVFVSEFTNSRVLRFASLNDFLFGNPAEAVFGQPDFVSNALTTTATGMNHPGDLHIDAAGRLWVADVSNSRILRFDNAATKPSSAAADGVLGQTDFITSTSGITQSKMTFVDFIYVDDFGTLWASDRYRILRYDNAASKLNGANADGVLGQANFTAFALTASNTVTRWPAGIVKVCDRLYVASGQSNRIVWWDAPNSKPNGAAMDGVLGQPDFNSTSSGLSQNKFNQPNYLLVDDEGRLVVGDLLNRRIIILNEPFNNSFLANFDVVLGQANFTSSVSGVSQTRNGNIGGSSILTDGSRKFIATVDITNHRVIIRGAVDLVTPENIDVSSNLIGSDPSGVGSLSFSITSQPSLGSVTLDDSLTGAFTYNAPGVCGVNADSITSFQYSVTNGNGCIKYSSVVLRVTDTLPCIEICNDAIDNDGDGLVDCNDTTDCVPDIPGIITTSNDTICASANGEAYSIAAVAGATSYDWTVPVGATITAGQGTTTISVDWGSTSGNVCVRSYNGFCYSSFQCTYIYVDDVPISPGIIYH